MTDKLIKIASILESSLVPSDTYPKSIKITPIQNELEISWDEALEIAPELETLDGTYPHSKPVRVSMHENNGRRFLTFTPHTRDRIPCIMKEV